MPTVALIFAVSVYFSFKIGLLKPKTGLHIARKLKKSLFSRSVGGISTFSAVATALGGTVGIGSIVGVGYAISVGGAGSVFWMWVCSFFGMGLKYAETKVALKNRKSVAGIPLGGAPVRLEGAGYKSLAVMFCIICILVSFSTGNITQISAVSELLADSVPRPIFGIVASLLIALTVFGGRKQIAIINSLAVPLGCLIYIAVTVGLITVNFDNVGKAFSEIFLSAFGLRAVGGGFSGAVMAAVIREGFARSVFSGEAGMGSSPLAYSTSEEGSGSHAEWGIFEIFFDCFVISTLTAVALLAGGFASPAEGFSSLMGNFGGITYKILLTVFALASVASWCYYAECCIAYLSPNGRILPMIYRILFSAVAIVAPFISGVNSMALADILNALMMIPNLFIVLKFRNEIERIK